MHKVVDLLSLALTTGEAFLPDAGAYDDLVYKLVESGDALEKLRSTYALAKPDDKNSAVNTLIGVSKHYAELIASHQKKKDFVSPAEVGKIIKQGYDSLAIESRDEVGQTEKYREADHKTELKKIARVAVSDAAILVRGGGDDSQ